MRQKQSKMLTVETEFMGVQCIVILALLYF